MRDVLIELAAYVKYHFEKEEKIMQNISYPDLERQKMLHKDLVNQIVTILVDLKNGKEVSALELKTFLQKWLIDHILGEDKKIMAAFLVLLSEIITQQRIFALNRIRITNCFQDSVLR